MRLNPALIFVALLVVAIGFILSTVPALPQQVAMHFDFHGDPNKFADRDHYRISALGLLLALPLLAIALVGWLPRAYPKIVNLPNRDYWLAPQRAAETFAFMQGHAFRLGSLFIWLAVGLHWRILEAHKSNPPHLSAGVVTIIVPLFLVGVVLWGVALTMRFRKPPSAALGGDL